MHISFPALRTALRRLISRHLSSAANALSVVAGDFNYVAEAEDRMNLNTSCFSGRHDIAEEHDWQIKVAQGYAFKEMFQDSPTHASVSSRARLDRIYDRGL